MAGSEERGKTVKMDGDLDGIAAGAPGAELEDAGGS